MVVLGCWSISPQGTSLGKTRGGGEWMERQDLSSTVILYWKENASVKQGKRISGLMEKSELGRIQTSSELGEGRRYVMELDLPYSHSSQLVTASYNRFGKHL